MKRGVEIIELPKQETTPLPQPVSGAAPVLYVATPCFGCYMAQDYLASILGLQAACAANGIGMCVDFIGNESLVERARCILAERFLQSGATHLLFIDGDIGFDARAVVKLLQADKDVHTAVYSKKHHDWATVRRKLDEGSAEPVYQMGLDFNINISNPKEPVSPEGLVEVLDSATGFMLIKREAMQRVKAAHPELDCVNDIPNQTIKEYNAMFACMIDPVTRRFLSEDYSFCRRYQQLGGKIWADVSIPLAHVGSQVFGGDIRERLVRQ